MGLKIERGRRQKPVAAVVFGDEGIGKTTLAASFPNPIILDTEEGSSHIDCARHRVESWDDLRSSVAELCTKPQGFATVVIDSADWAEQMLVEHLCRENKWASIESPGYGKGHTMLAEQFKKFLSACDSLVAVGLHVVFVAHAKVARVSPPDMTDGYDRWELKLSKQVAPLLREWSDLLLFCRYETTVVEGSDGRKKAIGGKRRVMHTESCAAWSAKNRFGLPAKLSMDIDSLSPIFAAPAARPGWRDRVAAATTVEELGVIGDEADQAVSEGRLTPDLRERLDAVIDARQTEIEAAGTGSEVTA